MAVSTNWGPVKGVSGSFHSVLGSFKAGLDMILGRTVWLFR